MWIVSGKDERGWLVLIAFQLGFVCGRLLLLSQLVKFFIVEADRSLFVYDGCKQILLTIT